MSNRLSIAVLTGGYSEEAPISRQSAAMVMHELDAQKFDATLIHIDPEGWWAETDSGRVPVDRTTFSWAGKKMDGAFIMVHGTPGEDGKIQAILEAIGIPHTTGDSECMALTFNKSQTNIRLREHGITVAQSVDIPYGTAWDEASIASLLGFPCFVKPNEAGSSFGISRVEQMEDLRPAIQKAMATSNTGVLVEAELIGREYTVGVILDGKGTVTAFPVSEIRTPRAFFDYKAKYGGESEEITPAQISPSDTQKLQEVAVQAYKITQCRGIARVDMIMEEGGIPQVIEVNAVPGFAKASIIPKQAVAAGMTKSALITHIIEATIVSKRV